MIRSIQFCAMILVCMFIACPVMHDEKRHTFDGLLCISQRLINTYVVREEGTLKVRPATYKRTKRPKVVSLLKND